MFLRNAAAAALTVTLLAGALFLASGITRVIAAFQTQRYRRLMLIGGGVSVVLGLIVLFNVVEFSLTLLGVLLAVEMLADGITLALEGRIHVDPV